MIFIAILAAGRSTRFGSQKLVQSYHGKLLLQWPIDVLRKISAEKLLVVSKTLDVSLFDLDGFKLIINEKPEYGISSSVKLAVSAAKGHEGILLLLGDMPKISTDLVKQVISMDRKRIVFPSHDGIKGFPVYLPSKYFEEAMSLSGDVGLRKIIAKHTNDVATFDGGEECIFDVDTPQDIL